MTSGSSFTQSVIKKDDLEAALRGYQAAVDAAKSRERDEMNKMIHPRYNYKELFGEEIK